ncbi:VWA domain-containing protein [bacterium]|nr:VWA domain-containing protein [bacterium]
MWIELAYPLLMWALLPLGLHAWWMSRRLGLLSKPRRFTALGMRLFLLTLLLMALAGARWTRQSEELKVLFLLDESESIPAQQREYATTFIQKSLEQMTTDDKAGIIVFGADSAVDRVPEDSRTLAPIKSVVEKSRTNLAGAMSLALAVFIGESQKRIVILSDGNQNQGDAVDAARAAATAGVAVDVLPLTYHNRNDVILEKTIVENRVSLDEPFDVRVIATSTRATEARLTILQDGKPIGTQNVRLEAGKKNAFVAPTQVKDAGFHTFEAVLDAPGDSIPANNRGFAFTYGQGNPRVLLVDGDEKPNDSLPAVLISEKIDVQRIRPDALPQNIRDFQSYDAVIFNNVAAGDITNDQMLIIENAVHSLGMGFMMIGGEHSFGAGGYNDSPIERIMPVEMEIKNEKVMPQGALVTIIHTCEIPEGEMWAEKIVMAALDALGPRDLMGTLYYGYPGGESWLFPLQEVGNKGRLRGLIKTIQPGDMPNFDRTLQMAYDALAPSTASVKHVVVISDGDAAMPTGSLIAKLRKAQITLSTVVINPHNPQCATVMQQAAKDGGGNFYDVKAYNKLPQIFIKEAATVRKSLIFNDPFLPVTKQQSPILSGIGKGLPVLGGYVGTTKKDLADVPLETDKGDPLLATWREGVGKTVAFTSDAKDRWGAQWVTWNQYSKFWAQAVRWCLRPPNNPNYQVQMDIEGGKGKITIDAVDAAGNFKNFLDIKGKIISPDNKPLDVGLKQVSPGRYEGDFPVEKPGTYMLGGTAAENSSAAGDLVTGGAALSYSPEFQDSRSNDAFLSQLADISKYGRRLDDASPVFLHNLPSRADPTPLWPWLLALALPTLLADIFTRRVLVGWSDIGAGWAWVQENIFRRRRVGETTSGLLDVKRQVREQAEQQREDFLASLKTIKESSGGESPVEQAGPRPPEKKVFKPVSPVDAARPRQSSGGSEGVTGQLLKARERARKKDEPKQ